MPELSKKMERVKKNLRNLKKISKNPLKLPKRSLPKKLQKMLPLQLPLEK